LAKRNSAQVFYSFKELAESKGLPMKIETKLKRDGDRQYIASAYAYVPDAQKPSTWRLRVKNYIGGKLTLDPSQLRKAAAALSSEGYRGNKVQLPACDVEKVKAKLRGYYKTLGLKPPKGIQASPQESATAAKEETFLIMESGNLSEKAGAEFVYGEDGLLTHIKNAVLLGSVSLNKRRYSVDVMKEAAPRYNGIKMYLNHSFFPTGRPVQELFARVTNPRVNEEEKKLRGDVTLINHEGLVTKLAKNAPDLVGLSHAVDAKFGEESKDGWVNVEKITKPFSVDLVTDPATTKGIFESYFKAKEEKPMNLEELKEKYPELVSTIETEAKAEVEGENLAAKLDAATKKAKRLEEAVAALTEEKAADETLKVLEQLLGAKECTLPDPAKDRLRVACKGKALEEEQLKKLVEAEVVYVKKITPETTVTDVPGTALKPEGSKKLQDVVKEMLFANAGIESKKEGE
jgi:hypothetical protein